MISIANDPLVQWQWSCIYNLKVPDSIPHDYNAISVEIGLPLLNKVWDAIMVVRCSGSLTCSDGAIHWLNAGWVVMLWRLHHLKGAYNYSMYLDWKLILM